MGVKRVLLSRIPSSSSWCAIFQTRDVGAKSLENVPKKLQPRQQQLLFALDQTRHSNDSPHDKVAYIKTRRSARWTDRLRRMVGIHHENYEMRKCRRIVRISEKYFETCLYFEPWQRSQFSPLELVNPPIILPDCSQNCCIWQTTLIIWLILTTGITVPHIH